MLSSLNAQKSGICDIYPEITHQFLSLNDLSTPLPEESDEQCFLRALLINFDLLTSCNLRDFLRAKRFFKPHKEKYEKNELLNSLIDALFSWSNLDYSSAKFFFNEHLNKYPCDVIAIFMLHMLDFCCGNTTNLLNLIQRLDTEISHIHPLYGYYLAIKSFVVCESGQYRESLEIGLKSCRLIEDNIYAIHAVSHAYHEMGEHEKIIEFLNTNMPFWISNPGMQMHVYWHMALAELSLLSLDNARAAFHTFYSMKTSPDTEQDLDAVGFLWRYKLCFPDDGQYSELWSQLADNWTGCIGASTSYFHDLHAALAFAAADKPFLIKKMIARSDGTGIPEGAHIVGTMILQSIYHYSIGQYDECATLLSKTKKHWSKIGGSHAQRDLLCLTLQDALCRSKAHV
jgi:tetratricopeptide (TPR) repeat protein